MSMTHAPISPTHFMRSLVVGRDPCFETQINLKENMTSHFSFTLSTVQGSIDTQSHYLLEGEKWCEVNAETFFSASVESDDAIADTSDSVCVPGQQPAEYDPRRTRHRSMSVLPNHT